MGTAARVAAADHIKQINMLFNFSLQFQNQNIGVCPKQRKGAQVIILVRKRLCVLCVLPIALPDTLNNFEIASYSLIVSWCESKTASQHNEVVYKPNWVWAVHSGCLTMEGDKNCQTKTSSDVAHVQFHDILNVKRSSFLMPYFLIQEVLYRQPCLPDGVGLLLQNPTIEYFECYISEAITSLHFDLHCRPNCGTLV
ncbi:hypothetical protein GQX74_008998 [Glossina fuscipes]|nr:hypothetical protein GQX74_008998 [Glossina fuscipes]